VKTTFFGISAYQVPNKERFSYRAALLQSEWQKKSAGQLYMAVKFITAQYKAIVH
jgi:hypothetical protein